MKKASVIGIGEAGKYVINKITEENSKTNTIYLCYDEEDKEGCKADIIVNVRDGIEPLKQIRLKDNVFVFSHLGDQERDRVNRELKSIISENSHLCEICLFPCTFEGRQRLSSSIETLEFIGDKAIILDGDLLLKDIDTKVTAQEFFNMTYEMLYTNYKDYAASRKIKNEKYIVYFKENEMRQRKIEIKESDNEWMDFCCMGFRRNRSRK